MLLRHGLLFSAAKNNHNINGTGTGKRNIAESRRL
jgi:hypothetical protein